ncbi:MAG: LysR substrate-binding domain-containing protein [Ancalomicrobiaceae bacterium]|nr:LysR substrate-binding domain-containing protein [Ancalomicrobiaceae bacterium]
MEIFRAVVAEGGVLRAAARLNRVPSNVTTRIRHLEQRLGVALFRRQGRGLSLSAEGEKLLSYAERLLSLSDEAVLAVGGSGPLGRFRLGSLESTAGVRLPSILAEYHALHPEVSIELSTAPTAALIQRVLKFEIDAAFVSEPFAASELESIACFDEELILIAPSGLSEAEAQRAAERTVVAFAQGCSYRRRLEEWLAGAGTVPARVLEVGSYHAVAACVAAGAGAALMPVSVLDSLPARDQVSRWTLPPEIAANRTHLVWKAPSTPSIEALLRVLGVTATPGSGSGSAPFRARATRSSG